MMINTGFNPFWVAYKNLEDDFVNLSKNISIDDEQLDVYSMIIADMLVICSVQIEAISKALYEKCGGPVKTNKKGQKMNLSFDSDCIDYLDKQWSICNKVVYVSSSYFSLSRDENRILIPLKDCNQKGMGDWKKAYQNVKHDRMKNLPEGNLKNLIRALASLYMLNLYYSSSDVSLGVTFQPRFDFDSRMGSKIFSVSFVDATVNFSMGLFATDEAIDKELRDKMKESIYVLRCIPDPWKKLQISYKYWNNHLVHELGKSEAFVQDLLDKKDIENQTLYSLVKKYTEHNPQESYSKYIGCRSFAGIPKEAVINKNQPIYG